VALAALQERSGNGHVAHGYEYSRILLAKCFLFWMAADLPNLERRADELLHYAEQHELPESVIWARYFHGCACYQLNDLPAAYEDFSAVIHSQHVAPGFVAIQGAFGLAQVLQAQGNADAATAAAAMVLEYAQQTNNSAARQAGQAFGAYLALLQDRLDDAFNWVAGSGRSFLPAPMETFFAPPPATAAILLQHHTQTSLNEAEQMLRQMETYLAATHVNRFRAEVLALQALLYARRGQRAQALTVLEEAVTLAQPGGLQRVFLDLGPALRDLLAELKLRGARGAFVQQLCAATTLLVSTSAPVSSNVRAPAVSSGHATPTLPVLLVQPRHPDLIELLTNRELEVLQLLALRLTNKEIAQALSISTGTVKQHTINIYRKLHVENRRAAIHQARAMGFQIETPYPL
jgi:LuxR family maltose regulon positive regulatory protein